MNDCGGEGVYIPSTECDDCGNLGQRIVALEEGKQDTLIPGANITIENNVISSTGGGGGGGYTAGTNIDITGNQISAPNVYSKAEVNTLLADLEHIRMEKVTTLPTTGEANVIYLVPRTGGGYEQWIYAGTEWIDIGAEDIDLTDYYTKTETDTLLDDKQDVLTAGDNVTITGSTISAKDTTNNYYASSSTAAGTAAKTATVAGSEAFELKAGVIVGVNSTNTNTANNPTLNVNSKGAKPIFYNGVQITTQNLDKAGTAGQTSYFMYDGTRWWWMGHSKDESYPPLYGVCASAGDAVAKTVNIPGLDALTTGVTIRVKFDNYNRATNPTLNVNSLGALPIYKFGATNVKTSPGVSWEDGGVVSLTYDGVGWVMNDFGLDILTTDYNTSNMARRVILFNDYTMITVMTYTATNVAVTTAWGSVYYSAALSLGNWPVQYNSAPMAVITQRNGNDILGVSLKGSTYSSAGTVTVYRPTSGTAAEISLCMIAIGRLR